MQHQEAPIAPPPKKTVKKTATKKPAVKKPAAKKAAVKKATAKKPVAKKPAAKKTATAKPSVKKTAAKKTVARVTAKPKPVKNPNPSGDTLRYIVAELEKEKGDNLVTIDLTGKSAIADYMVIISGTSSRAVVSMAQKLRDKLSKIGIRARVEGTDTGDWVVLDAGDVIVHLFRPEVRTFYNLEKLWQSDFSAVDYTLYK